MNVAPSTRQKEVIISPDKWVVKWLLVADDLPFNKIAKKTSHQLSN